ncbi:MAG: radical SAM protein [Candidatus Brocadiaceae bacterium]|jgi:hypothetical protein
MDRILIYNFSGEIDDLSHLLPNDRMAQLAAIMRSRGTEVEVWDRGNAATLGELAPAPWKRKVASAAGGHLFRKLARNRPLSRLDRLLFGLPLKWTSGSMAREIERNYAEFMRQEAARIAGEGFDAVLLNVWQGGFHECMALAETLKEAGSTRIYATGQRVDWFREHILRLYPQIDGILLGLAYEAARRLAAGEPFESLPDVAYRDGSGGIAWNERTVTEVEGLPRPDYSPPAYRGIEDLIPLVHVSLSNQACPNRCAFCPRPVNYGHAVRRKPVEQAVEEVTSLRREGIRHFRIADSTPPPGLLTDFARSIVERGLSEEGVHFTAFARIDQNRREDFELLREAHFESLFFGLETLDDRLLERIRKGITYDEIRDTLRAAHGAGLFVVGSLIFPLPHETEETRDTTLRRLGEVARFLDSVLIQPAGVYPSSDWGTRPEEFGIHLSPHYVEKLMNYPVKFIIPMRFWPPFPFAYPLMGKDAREVTFRDILEAYESFSSRVWDELGLCNVQDYTLLIARMVGEDSYEFTDHVKKVLVTRDYDAIGDIVRRSRRHLA